MKKLFLILSIICFNDLYSQWWDMYYTAIEINFNGVKTTYTISELGATMDYDGATLGTFTSNTQSLSIYRWYVGTQNNQPYIYKYIFLEYLLYEEGNRPPSPTFNQLEALLLDTTGPNETWGQLTSTNIDITTLVANKTYKLEVYVWGTGNGVFVMRNNNGANYIATFSTTSIFPVELVNFTATISSNSTTLNWQTATEVNNYGFSVQRKAPNNEWKDIAFVDGHGNSNSPKEYSFIDSDILSGVIKYRLKQIDSDGGFEYSDVVEVEINTIKEFKLSQNYPNPFNPTTKIEFSIPSNNNVKISVFNVLGKEVATLLNEHREAGKYSVEFNADNLSSGIYFYKIVSGNYANIKKMVLLR